MPTPKLKIRYIPTDILDVSRVRIIFMAWGIKANVVQAAAISPIDAVMGVIMGLSQNLCILDSARQIVAAFYNRRQSPMALEKKNSRNSPIDHAWN